MKIWDINPELLQFKYSPLGEVSSGKIKKDKQNNRTDKTVKKREKNLVYKQQHSFQNLKILVLLKNCHLILHSENLMHFIKYFLCLKNLKIYKQKKEDLKEKVEDNAGDPLNELYYIYKKRYSEEKNGLNTKNINKFYFKKLRLMMIISTSLKKNKKQQNKAIKGLIKESHRTKPTEIDAKEFNELINKEETN